MKKSILFLFLLLGLVDNAIAQVQPTDSDGDGFINISTLEHLRWVSENSRSWDDNFELIMQISSIYDCSNEIIFRIADKRIYGWCVKSDRRTLCIREL